MAPATGFRWLAAATAVCAYFQISLGGVVRVSGSGMGCSDQWPPCRGGLLPPLEIHAIIEFAHRVFGLATSLLMLATAVTAWVVFRRRRAVVAWLATAALAVVALEVPLGALVVFRQLTPMLVLAHLSVALAILGLLVATAVLSGRPGRAGASSGYRRLAWLGVGLTYLLLLTGSTVVASAADESCRSWPLCGGGLQPDFGGVNGFTMLHRVTAGLVGVFLLYVLLTGIRTGTGVQGMRAAAAVTALTLAVQVAVGAGAAIAADPALFNGLHVATGTAVWAGIVATACLTMPRPEIRNAESPRLLLEGRPA